jgi:hypothetical protein
LSSPGIDPRSPTCVELLVTEGGVHSEPDLVHLLRELLAALRRTDAVAVTMTADVRTPDAALRAVGLSSAQEDGAPPEPYTVAL